MSPPAQLEERALEGWAREAFEHAGSTRAVYRRGEGPGVVIMHEVPGITPTVERFARRVADEGFAVYLPHLFGEPGRAFSVGYAAQEIARACVSREFSVLAARGSSPITDWLRALCRRAHERCGGPGVGAIGMCLTGNFALALMVDEAVMAPVLSQPSLPFGITPARRRGLHLSDEDLAVVRRRARAGCPVLALRFSHDAMVPRARFAALSTELGEAFEELTIDSGPGNAHGIPRRAHSVLSLDLVDEEGHPTRAAADRVLAFMHERLRAPGAGGADGAG